MSPKQFAGILIAIVGGIVAISLFGWTGGLGFTLAIALIGTWFFGVKGLLPAVITGLLTLLGYYGVFDKFPDMKKDKERADIAGFLSTVISAPSVYGLAGQTEELNTAYVACGTTNIKALRDFAIAAQEATLPPAAPAITEPLKKLDNNETAPPDCFEVIAELSSRSPKFKEDLEKYLETIASPSSR